MYIYIYLCKCEKIHRFTEGVKVPVGRERCRVKIYRYSPMALSEKSHDFSRAAADGDGTSVCRPNEWSPAVPSRMLEGGNAHSYLMQYVQNYGKQTIKLKTVRKNGWPKFWKTHSK